MKKCPICSDEFNSLYHTGACPKEPEITPIYGLGLSEALLDLYKMKEEIIGAIYQNMGRVR